MQSVADLHFLEFAQIAVELDQRVVRALVGGDAAVDVDTGDPAQRQDLVGQQAQPARIDRRCLGIFVDQPLKFAQRSIAFGPRQGRRQVIDDHRLSAALRLRALSRIVDDERIKVRQSPERDFRKAGVRQGQCLTGQPLQIAVLSKVNDGMRAKAVADPRMEGEVAVRRRQVRIVIARRRVDVVATRRLQADRDVAAAEGGNGEAAAIEFARKKERIALGRSPSLEDAGRRGSRQAGEEKAVVGARKGLVDASRRQRLRIVGRAGHQPGDQRVAVLRNVLHPVAGGGKRAQHGDGARRRIQADAVADAAVPVRIVGKDDGDPPLGGRRPPQPHPVGSEFGDEGDPVRFRLVGDDIRLGERIAPRHALERDGAADDASVHFRQRHVHRDVARRQPLQCRRARRRRRIRRR